MQPRFSFLSLFFLSISFLLSCPSFSSDQEEETSQEATVGSKRTRCSQGDGAPEESFRLSHKKIRREEASPAHESLEVVEFLKCTSERGFQAKLYCKEKDLTICVKRLSNAREDILGKEAVSLKHHQNFIFVNGQSPAELRLFVPKIYAALDYLTGENDDTYDPFKGSFSFEFFLSVTKNERTSQYVYNFFQYRSFVDSSIGKLFDPDEEESESCMMYEPIEGLFSKEDIMEFSKIFFQRLLSELKHLDYKPYPFILKAPSNLLIAGYIGQYFVNRYEDYDECQKAWSNFTEHIKTWQRGFLKSNS